MAGFDWISREEPRERNWREARNIAIVQIARRSRRLVKAPLALARLLARASNERSVGTRELPIGLAVVVAQWLSLSLVGVGVAVDVDYRRRPGKGEQQVAKWRVRADDTHARRRDKMDCSLARSCGVRKQSGPQFAGFVKV